MSRLGPGGVPWDMHYITRISNWLLKCRLTSRFKQFKFEKFVLNRYDHLQFGLKPESRLWKIFPPIISDELPMMLRCGKIVLKSGVVSFHSHPLPFVYFDDGSIETGLDFVIMHTGFSLDLELLSKLIQVGQFLHFEQTHSLNLLD